MERSRPVFDAQAVLGCRGIFRTPCTHRLVCETTYYAAGRWFHADGLCFADEAAAQRFDLGRTAPDACGRRWHTFGSWEAAETWLMTGCLAPIPQ